MNTRFAASAYAKVQNHSSIEVASPHKLVLMLFDGALERIVQAKGAMQYGNIEQKGKRINSAISVVSGLRESLDSSKGGDIADNLDGLYVYIQDILFKSHVKNDIELLDEAAHLLSELRGAWAQIG